MAADAHRNRGADPDLRLKAEQIGLLAHKRADILVNLLAAGLVCDLVWQHFRPWVIGTWLVVFCLLQAARFIVRRHYIAAAPGIEGAPRWAWIFVLFAFASGAMWGATGTVILVTPDILHHVLIIFVLGGVMAGGIVSNSAYRPVMLAFMVPTILPAIVFLIRRGDSAGIEMGLLLGAFAVLLMITGHNVNQLLAANFRLKIMQDELSGELAANQAVLAEAEAIGHIGSWVLDAQTNDSIWSLETFRILGVNPSTTRSSHRLFMAHVHEADRTVVEKSRAECLGGGPGQVMEYRIVADDGAVKWVREATRTTFGPEGRALRVSGSLQDISDTRQSAEALNYRDRLLHAITAGTTTLLEARSLDEGMPKVLGALGGILAVDRFLMLRNAADPGAAPVLCYMWQAPDTPHPVDPSMLAANWQADAPAVTAWRTPLLAGQSVSLQLAGSEGALRALLEYWHNKSTLLVPIFAGGRLWGNLGIDACAVARNWTAIERDTLRIFADVVGSIIQRAEALLQQQKSATRMRLLSETAQDGIITVDGAGRISTWNASAEHALGYSAAEAIGKQVHELLAPARFRSTSDPALALFATTGAGAALGKTTELAARRKDGSEVAVELSLSAAQVGSDWEAIGIMRDITARREAKRQIEYANMLLTTQMEASLDGILIVDEHRHIKSYNRRFAEIWEVPLAALQAGDDRTALAAVTSKVTNPEDFLVRVRELYARPGVDSQEELTLTDGRFVDRYTVTLYSPAREYLGRAWFFRDVTARKQAEALALRMARFDVLTGLANRGVFVDALQHAIAAAIRGGKGFAVIYLDLDHFKDVNDTLGHPVGDLLLQEVARRLRANTRATDTVARFGGDEFAVVAAETENPQDAALLADKLIKAIGAPYSILGSDIRSGASAGIAAYGPDAPDAETLLSHADIALYRAKSEGRSGYRFFTDAMDVEVQNRVTLGAELRTAVETGQLFLMYQPQVAVDTGQITGLEALVRWRHPTRGVLSPNVFIPIAEQTGIIAMLGHWVLWAACRQAKAWRDAGIAPVRISVNVSAPQFRVPGAFEADITAALAETGLAPEFLELELTESVFMDAVTEHAEVIQRLRNTGIALAIDDFGTGYSSLDYLRRFRSNRLKIAQTFVRNLDTTPENASIVKATISLARELGINVIAEGVETLKQVELLSSWGCTHIQGFYYSRPLGADETARALRTGFIRVPALVA